MSSLSNNCCSSCVGNCSSSTSFICYGPVRNRCSPSHIFHASSTAGRLVLLVVTLVRGRRCIVIVVDTSGIWPSHGRRLRLSELMMCWRHLFSAQFHLQAHRIVTVRRIGVRRRDVHLSGSLTDGQRSLEAGGWYDDEEYDARHVVWLMLLGCVDGCTSDITL